MMGFAKKSAFKTRFFSLYPSYGATHSLQHQWLPALRRNVFRKHNELLANQRRLRARINTLEIAVKALMFAAILSLGGPFVQSAAAQHGLFMRGLESALPTTNVRFEAPVGHRQPSVAEIDLGKTARDFRSPAEISADEAKRTMPITNIRTSPLMKLRSLKITTGIKGLFAVHI